MRDEIKGFAAWTNQEFRKLFPEEAQPKVEVYDKKAKKYMVRNARPNNWHPNINKDIGGFAIAGATPRQVWRYVKPEMEARRAGNGEYSKYQHVPGIIPHDTFAGLSRFRQEKLERLQREARAQAEKAKKEKLDKDVQEMEAMMRDMTMEKKVRLEKELEMLKISN